MKEENEKSFKSRVVYYDVLNIMACFCVIWMHCNVAAHVFSRGGNVWVTSMIVETIAYWAVPVFIMLTGATLMNYREKYDTKTFFKKRVLKTLVPFIIWSVVILVWKYYGNMMEIKYVSFKHLLNIMILNQEESVYWFFWALFSVYLSIPVLSHLTEEKHRKTLWYIVIVAFIFCSVPKLLKLIGIEWNSNFTFPIAGGYVIYIILGYLLSTQDIKKKKRIIIYILGILALFIRYFGTYYLSAREGRINKALWGYAFFTGLFPAVAVFVFTKNAKILSNIKNKKIETIISKVSSCSFGIYLIHLMVMRYEIRLLSINTNSVIWRTVGAVTTYFIALGIIYFIKKIPIIKKIVP